jgi:uncharacterized protein (TIGR02722 family)
MVNIMKVVVIAAIAATFSSGCSTSTIATETQLDRKAMTAALEPQDVRRTVEKMVDSMLADQEFIAEIGGKRPVLDITGIKNRSSMHLDMRSITSSIRTKLLRSRRFRFMDRSTAADDLQIMNDQALNGMTDQSKAVKMGRQSAAQMYLYGELSEMRQHVDGVTDRYYKFTLNLKDIGSGEIVWSDEQEIRKQQETSVFGM